MIATTKRPKPIPFSASNPPDSPEIADDRIELLSKQIERITRKLRPYANPDRVILNQGYREWRSRAEKAKRHMETEIAYLEGYIESARSPAIELTPEEVERDLFQHAERVLATYEYHPSQAVNFENAREVFQHRADLLKLRKATRFECHYLEREIRNLPWELTERVGDAISCLKETMAEIQDEVRHLDAIRDLLVLGSQKRVELLELAVSELFEIIDGNDMFKRIGPADRLKIEHVRRLSGC